MAVRGRIGRLPRTGQNLESMLVSLARERQSVKDSNIMSAWQNGGLFDGDDVTDKKLLAYWRGRKEGLDPNDPLTEQIKMRIDQLQYGIEQSKQDLLHVQGKISDQQFANFYLKWSKKVPRNSEFWRSLQKDAATLMERSKASSKASADAARVEAFNSFSTRVNQNSIAIGNALTEALTQLSKETGLSITDHGDELLERLTVDMADKPARYRILNDAIKAADPQWNGVVTNAYYSDAIDSAEKGYGRVASEAKKNGYVEAYMSNAKGQQAMAGWGSNTKVWPVAKQYDVAYNQYVSVLGDPNASEAERIIASDLMVVALTEMSKTPGIDEGSKAMLEGDAARLAGGETLIDSPSFGAAMLGHPGVTNEQGQSIGFIRDKADRMAKDPTGYTYGPTGQQLNYDTTGQGPIGVVPVGQIPSGAVQVVMPGFDGKPVIVSIMPKNVYASDPANSKADEVVVGRTLSWTVGNKVVTMFGNNGDDAQERWTETNPYVEGMTGTTDKEGNIHLVATREDPIARANQLDPSGTLGKQIESGAGTASHDVYSYDANGKVTNKTTFSYKDGVFTSSADQTSYQDVPAADNKIKNVKGETIGSDFTVSSTPEEITAAVLSPSRSSTGSIAGVTYDSPLAGSLALASSSLSQSALAGITKNDAYQRALIDQLMETYGTTNPLDSRVVAGWSQATNAAATARAAYSPNPDARARQGLDYPGVDTESTQNTTPAIHFGGPNLSLPGIPQSPDERQTIPPAAYTSVLDRLENGEFGTQGQTLTAKTPVTGTPPLGVTTYAGKTITPTPKTTKTSGPVTTPTTPTPPPSAPPPPPPGAFGGVKPGTP